MYRDVALSASLMCIDWLNVGRQIDEIQSAEIDYIHYDIIDGVFARDFTMGSSIIETIKNQTSLPSDYHLMVEEPSHIYEIFSLGSEDNFTIHQEACRNLHREIGAIKDMGAKVGVALSPGTNLDVLEYVIEDLDLVTLMTVNPGYMGQSLVPQVIKKIEKLRNLIENFRLQTKISVDGNVNPGTIPEMVAAGANVLVLGSSGLFRKDLSIIDAVHDVQNAVDKGLLI